tara:strand:+ start:991 stop:1305 length:315 start_codon:yes stop_codon:yes gene_type:complete
MPAAKKTTTTKTKKVAVKKAPVADITSEPAEQVKRPGRPPKAKTYSFTAYVNGKPLEFSFDDESSFNSAFAQVCNRPFSGRPAKILHNGKEYFIGKVDYVVRDV